MADGGREGLGALLEGGRQGEGSSLAEGDGLFPRLSGKANAQEEPGKFWKQSV